MELEKSKPNFFLYLAAFCVNLLTINSTTMYSWSSPSIPKLTSNDTTINPLGRPITSSEESLIASLSTLGSVVGTILAGFIAEQIGRRKTLILFSLPFFFGYIVIANANEVIYFYVTRFIFGLSAGCVVSVLPSFVGEISEDSNRGAIGSLFGVMSSIGNFLAFGIGPLLSIKGFAYVLMIPVSLFLIFISYIPESPYYHLSKNNIHEAQKSLRKIRSNGNTEKELLDLIEVVRDSKSEKVTWKDIKSSAATRRGFLVCCGLLLLQQALAISVIPLYLQPILEASGDAIPSNIASLIIATVQIISCTIATFVIDRIGRKILLHISAIGASISVFGLGTFFFLKDGHYNLDSILWLPIASLISFYMFFNFGFATIPWSISGELFANNVKSLCVSIASCLCLIESFLITLSFPFLRDTLGMGVVFYVFSAIGVLSSIFVMFFVVETKGKSFQEIQYELSGKKKVTDGSSDYE